MSGALRQVLSGEMGSRGFAMAKEQALFEVSSWDEWFEMCGDLAADLETYEDLVFRYHDLMSDADARDKAFASRHRRAFWSQDAPVSLHMLRPALVGICIGALALFALSVFLKVRSGIGVVGALTSSLFALAMGAAVGAALGIAIQLARRAGLIRSMGGMEERLASGIRYIPPKYRNFFCVDAIYHLHADYDIRFFDEALSAVDRHISNNAASYVPVHVLTDVPFSDTAALDAGSADEQAEPDAKSIPMLPEDIGSYTKAGVEDADEALAELIGMDEVKSQVRKMKRRLEFYGTKSAGGGGDHMAFLGDAGTGKSVTARIVTRLLYDFGYIRRNNIVEVDGEYLKSGFVGQTGGRTAAIVEWAKGGVLFIDEAYLLFNERDNSSVGQEAVGVLLKAMEDMRDDIVIILAGYEDDMNRLIASNEGFASRIKHKLYFKPYSAEELTEIFELFLRKSGSGVTEIEPKAREMLRRELDEEIGMPGFGNARSARNACDALLDIHADRFMDGQIDASKKGTITVADVEEFVAQQRDRMAADGRNFLATNHVDQSIVSVSELRGRTRRGADDWRRALDAMVGLEQVKREMVEFKERADFFSEDVMHDGEKPVLNVSMVGPAGTGKTTAAAVFTGMLYESGYVRENSYLDVNGDFFKAAYVGQTGKRTQAIIEYSKGMVLFIDEAYLLSTSAGSGHDFGAEAIGVLVDAMEKSRGELVVIFAGYEHEMGVFMGVNSGLASRVAKTLHFEPYSLRELMIIFQRMAAQQRFAVDRQTWPSVKARIESAMGDEGFGNGRFVRQLLQDCISRHASRWSRGEIAESGRYVLEPADVPEA